MGIKIEMSSVCFHVGEVSKKFLECKNIVESHGFEFGIQVHNSITKELYHEITSFDVPFTVHAPVFSEYLMNLAQKNFEKILAGFQSTSQVMQSLKCNTAVFHCFFMTEKPIRNDPARYGKVLRDAIDKRYLLKNTRVMDPKYLETDEFREYQDTVKDNMARLQEAFPSYILCVENDFPGIGNGNQSPTHLFYLECPVWLDIGHLWSSAILLQFDFYTGLDTMCRQCQVMGVHLNTNTTPINWDLKEPDGDTHSHFSRNFDMDMDRIIFILKKNHITHFTIEVINGDKKDIEFFIESYQSQ